MTTFEWKDFAISHKGPILSASERFVFESPTRKRVTREIVERQGDPIEVIEFQDNGGVNIWTKYRVWCVRWESQLGIEKLIFLGLIPRRLRRAVS